MELILILGAAIAVFSSLGVGLLSQRTGNPVRASSGATLAFIISLYLFTYIFRLEVLPTTLEFFGACFFAGSFVGMSSSRRMKKKGLMFAGAVVGFLLLFITPYFKGMGGALGTSAFIASCLTIYVPKAFRFLLHERKKTRSS